MEHPTTARVRELAAEGLTRAEIARRMDVSKQRVYQIAAKHGIECKRIYSVARNVELIERLKNECVGMTRDEASAQLGVPYWSIKTLCAACDFQGLVRKTNSTKGRFGEQTQRIFKEAPILASRGLTQTEAARELGIPRGVFGMTLWKYMPNLKWRNARRKP